MTHSSLLLYVIRGRNSFTRGFDTKRYWSRRGNKFEILQPLFSQACDLKMMSRVYALEVLLSVFFIMFTERAEVGMDNSKEHDLGTVAETSTPENSMKAVEYYSYGGGCEGLKVISCPPSPLPMSWVVSYQVLSREIYSQFYGSVFARCSSHRVVLKFLVFLFVAYNEHLIFQGW